MTSKIKQIEYLHFVLTLVNEKEKEKRKREKERVKKERITSIDVQYAFVLNKLPKVTKRMDYDRCKNSIN